MTSFIVYLITNTINGKIYVGQTIIGVRERWKGHCYDAKYLSNNTPLIDKAIAKHGATSFIVEEMCLCSSQEELNFVEILFIAALNSTNLLYGYNLRDGGARGNHSIESRQLMARIQIERARLRGKENWITNGVISKKLLVNIELPEGFWLGRTYKRVKKTEKRGPRKKCFVYTTKWRESVIAANKARKGTHHKKHRPRTPEQLECIRKAAQARSLKGTLKGRGEHVTHNNYSV